MVVVVVLLLIERRVREPQQNNKLGRFMTMCWKRGLKGTEFPGYRIVAAG